MFLASSVVMLSKYTLSTLRSSIGMLALGSDMSSDARACGEWDVDRDMLTDILTDWCAPSVASGGEWPTRAMLCSACRP